MLITFILLIMTESILANNNGSAFIHAIFLNFPYKPEYNDTNSVESLTILNSILETLQPQFAVNNIILQNINLLKLKNDPMSADMNLNFEIQTEITVNALTNIINNTIITSFGSNVTITNITIIQIPNFAGSTQSTESSLANTIANSLNTADTFTTSQTSVNQATTATITSEINNTKNTDFSTMPSSINLTFLPTTTADSLTTATKMPDDYLYNVIMECKFHNDTFDPYYNNKTSPNYIIYTNKITRKMREFLGYIALRLLYTIFYSLREGSVIVNVEMLITSRTAINNNELIISVRSAAVNAYGNSITITSIIVKSTEFPPFAIALIVATSVILIIAAIIIIIEISKQSTSNISKLRNDSDSENFEMETKA